MRATNDSSSPVDTVPQPVADNEELRRTLCDWVNREQMWPSEALETWCEANNIRMDALLELATEVVDYDPYSAAFLKLDSAYCGKGDELSELLDYLSNCGQRDRVEKEPRG
jgi:hypothetical protein